MSVHTSGDGKKKPSGLVVGCLVVGIFLTVAIGLRKVSDMSVSEEAQETEVSTVSSSETRVTRDDTPTVSYVSYEWHRITLPQGDADWPSWIQVPVGHTITFCDPVKDPGCSAKDFSDVRYTAQCRSLADGQPRDQQSGECTWTDAYRARAKGPEPMPLLYRFKRAS